MKVKELIEFLKKQPQEIEVAFQCFSEQCILEADHIDVVELSKAREDGWVHHKRDDKETQEYLLLPGN